MTDADLSIQRITQIAISEACDAISHKIGRELTAGESNAVAAIIDTEHFWARAEELQMFVQHNDSQAVSDMLTLTSERYEQFGKASFGSVKPVAPQQRDCGICNGSGQCYCLRKGWAPQSVVLAVLATQNAGIALVQVYSEALIDFEMQNHSDRVITKCWTEAPDGPFRNGSLVGGARSTLTLPVDRSS